MSGERSPSAADVLAVLADVSDRDAGADADVVIPLRWFRWMPLQANAIFNNARGERATDRAADLLLAPSSRKDWCQISSSLAERLAAVDQVRLGKRTLQLGWLWVAGTERGGRRVFHPLVTVPVRVVRAGAGRPAGISSAGDVDLSDLITDFTTRDVLERHIEVGGARSALG